MKFTHIPFQQTGFFSKTMSDYLEKNEKIQQFYHNFPDVDGFAKQIEEKKNFPTAHRDTLVTVLDQQYKNVAASELTLENIQSLQNENTFTITTGHQLNLFTGPLYFLYKIISTINLCEELGEKFPEQHFVPVYWMATEDHDFDEINYFNFKGKKVVWNRPDGGAVGRFSLEGLEEVLEEFSKQSGTTRNANYIQQLFEEAYVKHSNLSEATRYLANELFKEYGLVILDADDAQLKTLFAPIMKDELLHQSSYKAVSKTIPELEKNYKVQVNPREINLFYLSENSRDRIIEEDGQYVINDTEIVFSEAEILQELESHPESFSPNVIMRPLYQEVILPNLCYIGGGGELAYWLELKGYFEKVQIAFPIVLLRNSVQIASQKQAKKLNNLNISWEELFLKQHDLLAKKVRENSDLQFSFSDGKELLAQQFLALRRVANETDVSFIGAVDAQERKQLKGLENLEKRLLRAEKRKHADLVTRITTLQNELLPNQSLEERQRNFSEFYIEYGSELIVALKESLKPLQLEFTILEL
ncbi:MAG: bacillithiol biosynthesis cysteine-adding enzyme BshC [Flavobacteriaceae bacterium]